MLLCFGYRVIAAAMKQGLRLLFTQLVQFVVQFFISEKIACWVAAQGGWVSQFLVSVRLCFQCSLNMSLLLELTSYRIGSYLCKVLDMLSAAVVT